MTLALSCEVVHEKLWKSVNICKSYSKKISGTFFSGHGVYTVMRCTSMSVCPSRSYILSKRVIISSDFFSPSGSQAILVFPYQTSWQYSDGNPNNGGVECRWGRQKSRFWANIWLRRVLSTLRPPGDINTVPLQCGKLVIRGGVCWWRETTTKCLWQEVSTLRQRQQNSI